MSGGWNGSTRRDGLPSWWPVTRRRIIARDKTCKCEGCPKCDRAFNRCHRPCTDVDHLGDPGDHRDIVLAGKCGPCHDHKSSLQGNAAKAARRRPTRPPEKHPGDLT